MCWYCQWNQNYSSSDDDEDEDCEKKELARMSVEDHTVEDHAHTPRTEELADSALSVVYDYANFENPERWNPVLKEVNSYLRDRAALGLAHKQVLFL